MNDCIFCKIAEGEIPSQKIYEDELFLAFKDIKPKAPFHVLLIPKEHLESIAQMRDDQKELIGSLIIKARDITKKEGISDYRLVFNSGIEAGQEVNHLHCHILGGTKLGDIV